MNRTSAKTIPLGLIAALVLLALTAASAMAAKNQLTVIEDPARMLSTSPETRTASLDETRALGADIAKIPVTWRAYVPDGESPVKPGVDLTNPDSYPAGAWDTLDGIVSGAQTRGMKVWLMITAPAPRWAVARETSPAPGAYMPDPAAYGEFVAAVAKRYPGVRYFSLWNELNLKRYMQPQSQGGLVQSAIHYRSMYRAGYKALTENGHSRDTIMFGELLPRSQSYDPGNVTRPLTWLREFFCLDANGLAFRGKEATRHKCRGFKAFKASGIAYHPYNFINGPLKAETASKDNAAIRYLPRLERLLDQAYKAKHLSTRKLKIYNSEFGFQTNPPDTRAGYAISKVPYYLNVSEYMTWLDPRVASYAQYLIVDDLHIDSFQTGLRFADGTVKPTVYAAFQTPMMVIKGASANRITVWGCLRAKPAGTVSAELQVRQGDSWTTVKTIPVSASSGYFMQSVAVNRANSKTFRVSWSGGTSRSSRPGTDVRMRTD
ncbi:MAG: hypothetical protein JHD02_00530 [Thermoleophilaceae bacterium]|nr:hypothetical protein [Thermoleophilaceae bacterium]